MPRDPGAAWANAAKMPATTKEDWKCMMAAEISEFESSYDELIISKRLGT